MKSALKIEKASGKIGIKHGIHRNESNQIFANASQLNNNQKLVTHIRGNKANDLASIAIDRAYKLSIKQPNNLRKFVEIYKQKHITSNSYIHFGIKKFQQKLLAEFIDLACQLITLSIGRYVLTVSKRFGT